MENKAKEFSTRYHSGQLRKYTNEPYINHPSAVVELVCSVPHTETMICAAWLHDVVEDTSCTLKEIDREFGIEIARLVEMLTDISKPSDGKRSIRKAIDRDHIASATPSAKTIKLADLIDNTRNIIELDHDFAKVYLAEKFLLLEVLSDGDATLLKMAKQSIMK